MSDHRRITGRLVIATHNPGKLAESHEHLAAVGGDTESLQGFLGQRLELHRERKLGRNGQAFPLLLTALGLLVIPGRLQLPRRAVQNLTGSEIRRVDHQRSLKLGGRQLGLALFQSLTALLQVVKGGFISGACLGGQELRVLRVGIHGFRIVGQSTVKIPHRLGLPAVSIGSAACGAPRKS